MYVSINNFIRPETFVYNKNQTKRNYTYRSFAERDALYMFQEEYRSADNDFSHKARNKKPYDYVFHESVNKKCEFKNCWFFEILSKIDRFKR